MSASDSFSLNVRLANLTEAAAQNFDWGLVLGKALAKKEAWDSQIWRALCRAWLRAVSTDEQRVQVLSLLLKHPRIDRFADSVADLLVHWWWADKTADPSPELLSQGEEVAQRLWTISNSEVSLSEQPTNGWLHEAINDPGAKVVQFWLYTLSLVRKRAGDTWSGTIPQLYRDRLESAIAGTSRAAQLGRVLVASQARFLFALDPIWTKRNVLPLLDFSINVQRADAAWDALLSWGTWDEAILPELLPLYERSFQHLLKTDHSKRDRLCEHLANIAVFASINPVDNGWLDKFVVEAPSDSRAAWALYVRQSLGSLSDDRVTVLWDRWLGRYWDRRNHGYPKPLQEKEIAAMGEWLPHMGAVFAEAVLEFCKAPAPKYEYTTLYAELSKRDIPGRFPSELTKVLLHLLPKVPSGFSMYREDLENLVKMIPSHSIPVSKAKALCDELGRIGCANASTIFASFQSAATSPASASPASGASEVFQLVARLPAGNRSKAEIDSQIEKERESWERDR
jgi:uncharacterized protein DUF4020